MPPAFGGSPPDARFGGGGKDVRTLIDIRQRQRIPSPCSGYSAGVGSTRTHDTMAGVRRGVYSMQYSTPSITDFGGIGSHTFINPGGQNKGQPGHDPFGEISVHDGGS